MVRSSCCARGVRIAACMFIVCIAALSFAVLAPRGASANAGPFIVDGHVTDNADRPVVGASVVVVMKNGATVVDTQSATTDSSGFYTVTIGTDLWQSGYSVTSTATFNSLQVTDTQTIGADPFMTIDLQYPFEIPQFGSVLGFALAAGLVGAVAVVFLVRKSK